MAKKEIVIIGVGRYSLALIDKLKTVSNYSIVAIDSEQSQLEKITGVKNLIVGDASNEEFIKGLGIDNADYYIIGVGSDFETSAVIATNIKDNFKGTVIAKSVNPQHELILRKIGVEDIVSPEIAAAKKTFNNIVNPFALKNGDNYQMTEISEGISSVRIPIIEKWIGKMIKDIDWPKGIAISLIYKKGKALVVSGETILEKDETLTIVGEDKPLISLLEKLNKEIQF